MSDDRLIASRLRRMNLFDRLRTWRRQRVFEREVERARKDPSPERVDSLRTVTMLEPGFAMHRALCLVEHLGDGDETAHDLLARIVEDERWPLSARGRGLRRLAASQHEVVLQLAERGVAGDGPMARSFLAEALGMLDDPAVIPISSGCSSMTRSAWTCGPTGESWMTRHCP